jgi:dienelactone hydrolase
MSTVDDERGVIVFAHGSGSSRHSPRNRQVAAYLNQAGFQTVLLDLLTPDEESSDTLTGRWRFDVSLLTRRLTAACDWIQQTGRGTTIGLFGASTGAAAALGTAAARRELVAAVVSRGGRPDLAAEGLVQVHSPTLLIVGGEDHVVIKLNQQAAAVLGDLAQLAIVPGATHLFSEPGTLEQVAYLAAGWFTRWLSR